MATKTENLNLTKPDQGDSYDVDDFNSNFKTLDDYAGDTQTNFENVTKQINNHTHRLDSNNITGVTPITKGGTGATTASGAAKNLGVDDKADKEHKHSINDIIESDTKKILTADERSKLGQIPKFYYVIAASNTNESLKRYANVKCTGKGDETMIRTFIDNVPIGSTIYLLPGTYKFNAPLVLFKAVTLIGSGYETKLLNINGGYIISITSSFVSVQDMQLIRYTSGIEEKSNNSLVEFYSSKEETLSDIKIKGCIFDYKNGEENAQGSIIAVNNPNSLNNLIQLRILENTFVLNDDTFTGCVIDLSNVPSSVSAVVGANICTKSINIKVKDGRGIWTYGQASDVKPV